MASKLKQTAAGKQKRNLVEWFAEQISKASQSCANMEPSLRRTVRRDLEKAADDLMRDLGLSADDLDQGAEDINRMAEEKMSDEEREELRQRLEPRGFPTACA